MNGWGSDLSHLVEGWCSFHISLLILHRSAWHAILQKQAWCCFDIRPELSRLRRLGGTRIGSHSLPKNFPSWARFVDKACISTVSLDFVRPWLDSFQGTCSLNGWVRSFRAILWTDVASILHLWFSSLFVFACVLPGNEASLPNSWFDVASSEVSTCSLRLRHRFDGARGPLHLDRPSAPLPLAPDVVQDCPLAVERMKQ